MTINEGRLVLESTLDELFDSLLDVAAEICETLLVDDVVVTVDVDGELVIDGGSDCELEVAGCGKKVINKVVKITPIKILKNNLGLAIKRVLNLLK